MSTSRVGQGKGEGKGKARGQAYAMQATDYYDTIIGTIVDGIVLISSF